MDTTTTGSQGSHTHDIACATLNDLRSQDSPPETAAAPPSLLDGIAQEATQNKQRQQHGHAPLESDSRDTTTQEHGNSNDDDAPSAAAGGDLVEQPADAQDSSLLASDIDSGLRQRRRHVDTENSGSGEEQCHRSPEPPMSSPATAETEADASAEAATTEQTGDPATASTTAREEKGKEPEHRSTQDSAGAAQDRSGDANEEFSCNICFDTATDPVLTICGHLFCWSCLVQWLERSATCPVCKAGCDKDKVIPVYGRGREEKDPRLNANIPNRPAGQRPPPPPRQNNQFFGFDPFGVPGSFHGATRGGNFVFAGGFGFLPTLMGFSYTFASGQMGNGQQGLAGNGQPAGQQAFASRVFMMVAAMILVSILFY